MFLSSGCMISENTQWIGSPCQGGLVDVPSVELNMLRSSPKLRRSPDPSNVQVKRRPIWRCFWGVPSWRSASSKKDGTSAAFLV